MDISKENPAKESSGPLNTKNEINSAPPTQTSAVTLAGQNEPVAATPFLADPTYSGFGTWLGTVISIIAAFVAFIQARKARSIASRLQKEQKRKYVESTHKEVTRLNQVLKPIIFGGLPGRGTNPDKVVVEASQICHELLGSPIGAILDCAPASIKKIESNLVNILPAINLAKGIPPTADPFRDIQALIRAEIQLLLRKCTEYLDQDATK
jgi:hypothetical protein